MAGTGVDPDVERRLVELEAASDARRRELSDVMQHLPAEVSRRDVLRDSVHDLRINNGPASLVRRAGRTVADLSRSLLNRVRTRSGR
ncbi:hypothetical protein [Ilumatobacter sp.]|uniref:hypothetical protein n=1 Tax=Ilumatobacter sp. TaxID=1967498 RepID=UPI003C67E890